MGKDIVKSFADEPTAGKLLPCALIVGSIAHFLPWFAVTGLGAGSGNALDADGWQGVVSAIALVGATVVVAITLVAELDIHARRNALLGVIVLALVSAGCEIWFYSKMGSVQVDFFGGQALVQVSASWGLHLAAVCTVGAIVCAGMRISGLAVANSK